MVYSNGKSAEPIRVLLTDSHSFMRGALRSLLSQNDDLLVVAEAADCAAVLALSADLQPNIILLSFHLVDGESTACIPWLRAKFPSAHVIILAIPSDPAVQQRVVLHGARGLIERDHSAMTLLKAIERVHAGEVWASRAVLSAVLTELSSLSEDGSTEPQDGSRAEDGQPVVPLGEESASIATLTQREREIIPLICQGLKNQQIAEQLFISERTVNKHITSIYSKLGVSDRLELIIFSQRNSLVNLF